MKNVLGSVFQIDLTTMKSKILLVFLFPLLAQAQEITLDSIKSMPVEDGLFYALEYYGICEPHIVYAQAILETGHFKSTLCVKYGNLFGIYDNRVRKYKHYSHWVESVKDYRDSVQFKYQGGDYYYFLEHLPYAVDPDYIKKVRKIAEKYIEYD